MLPIQLIKGTKLLLNAELADFTKSQYFGGKITYLVYTLAFIESRF